MTIAEMQQALSQRAMSQDELNRSAIYGAAAQQAMGQQQIARAMLMAYHGYELFKCSRCGEVVESRAGIVDEEIAHAIKGCNGSLYEAR